MEEELGGTFVVAVDELGLNGLWSTIKDLVESRVPLQGLTLPNKVGKPVSVPRLPLMFVLCTDKRLLHLKQYSHSPVTWFRNPMTHLVLVSTADVHEYKSTTRAHLKRVTADIDKDWGGGAVGSEWLILYVRPFELEAGDKGARKVYEKLCDDFGSKRRERVVRLDVPLRAFDSPAAMMTLNPNSSSSSSSSSRGMGGGGPGSRMVPAAAGSTGTFVGPGGSALAAGLDDMCAGLRDSIHAAFEARKMAYDAEVRRLHNERRDPKWSFTTLYLVKDSFALMLEGAGLWEDAFQEYVELETVYLDCLESAAAASAQQGSAAAAALHSGGVGSHADFGLTGHDAEDVATLLSSSWRSLRGLVLRKRNVQEFQFRQYLFAAQARVLLRLNRPVDVAERGLVFVQNFLTLLAAKEAAGQLRPWFKECWAFSACMSLITAITTFMQRCHDLPTDWEVADILQQGGGPISSAAREALRQLSSQQAAAGAAAAGSHTSVPPQQSSSAAAASVPVLPPSAWQLGAVDPDALGLDIVGGSSGGGGKAAAAAVDEDVPPLDLALLCGRAIMPANVALLLQDGEQRRELMDKLYCCLLGHLYHLARGELLRLGSALQLSEAAAANASILQLGKAAFACSSPPKQQLGADKSSSNTRSSRSPHSRSSSPIQGVKQQQQQSKAAAAASSPQQGAGSSSASRSSLTAGVDLLLQASSSGSLSPLMVTQLQELLMTPLCGFSMMIHKYADGSSSGLTYEVHTPRLEQDPLAAALHRADSQSTPYLAAGAAAANQSPKVSTAGAAGPAAAAASGASAAAAGTAGTAGGTGMLDRLRRVGSGSSGSSGPSGAAAAGAAGAAAGAGAAGAQALAQQQQQQSRLSKVTGDFNSSSMDDEASSTAAAGVLPLVGADSITGGSSSSSSMMLRRQDSSTSLATVNIGGGPSSDGAAALSFSGGLPAAVGDDVTALAATDGVISLSGASVTSGMAAAAAGAAGDAGSVADSTSSMGSHLTHARTQSAADATTAAATGSHDLPSLPKVATHARSASALPATTGEAAGAAAGSGIAPTTHSSPPKALESSSPDKGLRARRAAAPTALQPSAATAAAAAAVPGWVGEWRLQLALRSPACFQELVLALSHRAAWCYAKGGRVRSSALIYADVAVLALQRGQLDAAARLLDRMHQIFTSEGWQQLLGVLLPKLLACQSLSAQHPMLPFTALRLLALKPGTAAAADRQAAFEELLAAVGAEPLAAAAGAGAGAVVVAAAGARAGVWQPSVGVSGGSSSSTVQLATLSAIQMRPAPGTFSQFFGNEAYMLPAQHCGHSGAERGMQQQQQQLVPVLSPPARPVGQQQQQQQRGGAALLVVGDSLPLAVDVVSTLPAPVLLQRPMLSLVQLHKSGEWISSSASTGALLTPAADASSSSSAGGGVYRPSGAGFKPSLPSSSAAAAAGQGKQQQQQPGMAAVWDAISGADRGGSAAAALGAGGSPRDPAAAAAAARWREGDELLATKLLAAFSPSSSSSGGDGDSSGSSSAQGSSSSSCRLLPDGSVLLAPGVNRLVFRVAPVRSGLYCLKQLRALLGVCGELIIGLPPPGSLSLLAAAAHLSSSGSSSGSRGSHAQLPAVACEGPGAAADVVQLGGVTSAGTVVSEVVVASVIEPAPRVRLEPVVPEGSLSVGGSAWLGLLVTPLQGHTLQRPRLHLQPNRHLALVAGGAGVGSSSTAAQQQQQQLGGLGGSSSSSSSMIEQQQQQALLGGLSASQLTAGSTSSSSLGVGASGHMQQQQMGHCVYVVPVHQHQQQQHGEAGAAAAAAASTTAHSNGSSSSRGGQWLPLRRGCVDLSDVLQQQQVQDDVLAGPLLVWMQVLVGSPPRPQATIPVAQLPPPHSQPQHNHNNHQRAPLAAGAAAAGVSKVVPQPCVLMASRAHNAVAEMLLQLEYMADAGVWRSHSSSLQVPLQHPVDISATALQLPSGAVAISVTLALDPGLKTALVLHQTGLRPQFGLIMGPGFRSSSSSRVQQPQHIGGSSGSVSGVGNNSLGLNSSSSSSVAFSEAVPLVLVPGGTAALSFLLLPDPGDKLTGSFEADGCNMLLLSYSTVPYCLAAAATDSHTGQPLPPPPPPLNTSELQQSAAAAGGGGGADGVAAAASGAAASLANTSSHSVGSGMPAAAAAGSGAGSVLSLQLPFWLQFPSADDSSPAAASVRVTLLGPQQGRTGQPVTLSWQLARIAPAVDGAGAGALSSVPLLDSSRQTAAAAAAAAAQQHSGAAAAAAPAESDELLFYELVFGQQQQQQRSAAGGDASAAAGDDANSNRGSSSKAPSSSSAAASAAAAADMGAGVSSSSNAALFWGLSGASAPSGVVRLGRAPGSLAVVEVVLCPRGAGRVSAPQLLLKSPGGAQVVLLEGDGGGQHQLTISRQ